QNGRAFSAPPAGFALQWASSAPVIAPVSGSGVVTGNALGESTVQVTAGSLTASTVVSVLPTGVVAGTFTLTDERQLIFSRTPDPAGGPLSLATPAKGWQGIVAPASRAARPARTRAEYVANTLIVRFRPGALEIPRTAGRRMSIAAAERVGRSLRAHLDDRMAALGGRIDGVAPALAAARVRVDGGRLEEARAALLRDPAVESVEREPRIRAAAGRFPDDELYPAQAWAYQAMDLPAAWRITTGSAAVTVAVLDDGIRFDHPDLAPNLTTDGYDFVSAGEEMAVCSGGTVGESGDGDGWDPDPTIPAAYDDGGSCMEGPLRYGGHGTHVAGTIGAAGNDGRGTTGVAWSVRIRPVRVLGVAGGTAWDIAAGIQYAAGLPVEVAPGQFVQTTRAHVINMSLAGTGDAATLCPAVTAAVNAGTLVVAAAGNASSSVSFYPAACADAISVIAVQPNLRSATYTNRGPTVDIAAPGGQLSRGSTYGVLSTIWDFQEGAGAYDVNQGTSMAAPHVAGVAALVVANEPGISVAELRRRLLEYAVDVGAPGRDDIYGAGLVNARNSLTQTLRAPNLVHARLYDVATGRIARQVPVSGGQIRVDRVASGSYYVLAGEDAAGDGVPGFYVPGVFSHRWGGHTGGGVRLATVQVQRASTVQTAVTVGVPFETEPNNTLFEAGQVMPGAYVYGSRGTLVDADYFAVTLPGGTYTFETLGWIGACGYALEEDTELRLYGEGGALLAENDDAAPERRNYCSRITTTLAAGKYYLAVSGLLTDRLGRYVLQVREGS
ncbi:MAG TPA: S8 family serine peptidase, partial [Longimicrobiaceae bacterium]|nr:S8 family serine peptidase [Longimicrobiaceae bacterium]